MRTDTPPEPAAATKCLRSGHNRVAPQPLRPMCSNNREARMLKLFVQTSDPARDDRRASSRGAGRACR